MSFWEEESRTSTTSGAAVLVPPHRFDGSSLCATEAPDDPAPGSGHLSAVGREPSAMAQVRKVLSALRAIDTISQLFEHAPVQIIRHCGFDCVAIFRIEGPDLVLVSIKIEGDEEREQATRQLAADEPPQLTPGLIEAEMLRRGHGALVECPQANPRVAQELAIAAGTTGYVAAPLLTSSGRPMGFLHADRRAPHRTVDAGDLQTISLLAEGLACIVERVVLGERLRVERDHIREMTSSLSTVARECCDAGIEMRDSTPLTHLLSQTMVERTAVGRDDDSCLNGLLTRRELEVLTLMAEGSTNNGIAEQLVITEATVKSHVKHILRKLRSTNRAQAVSRYLRLTEQART